MKRPPRRKVIGGFQSASDIVYGYRSLKLECGHTATQQCGRPAKPIAKTAGCRTCAKGPPPAVTPTPTPTDPQSP